MGQTKKARGIRDSAAKKIGRHCHVSAAFVRAELMGFVGLLLADKKRAVSLAAELALEAEEIALLLGSASTTKKVQSIFEEALKIRAAEEFEEIELGWRDRAQQPLALARAPQARAQAGAVQVGAGLTEAVPDSAEKTSVVVTEPPKAEAAQPVGPVAEAAANLLLPEPCRNRMVKFA